MRIFGRKAKTGPATPSAPVVPPELQPYYDGRTRGAQLRRLFGRLLPLLVAVVLAAALIGGALWLRNHRINQKNQAAQSTQRSQQQSESSPQKNNSQNSGGNSSNGSSGQSSGAVSSGGGGTNNQSPTPNTTQQATNQQATAMPNTGPGDAMIWLAVACSVAAAGLSYAHQLRKAGQTT